jgi:Ni/Co efflux regulator RcnB
MKKTALLLLLTGMVLSVPTAHAQGNNNNNNNGQNQNQNNNKDDEEDDEESNAEEGEGSKRFWQATLPSGNYMVSIDRISSISMHEYVLDSQLLVTEMVVDTSGRALARFYHVASVTEAAAGTTTAKAAERGRQLIDQAGERAGTNVHNLAQKNYPTTSHAGMVEYRVLNLNDLKALYKSLQSSWESNRGKTITIR